LKSMVAVTSDVNLGKKPSQTLPINQDCIAIQRRLQHFFRSIPKKLPNQNHDNIVLLFAVQRDLRSVFQSRHFFG
ncbi:MAG: hypothetical protein PVH19_15255, partial [Planctomycetia bacterium]